MKKAISIVLIFTMATFGTIHAQITSGTANNNGSNSSADEVLDKPFGKGFWNVYCYNGYSILSSPNSKHAGTYTEKKLSFDTKTRWANTGVPSNANSSSGEAYSGSQINTKHAVSYKRIGFPEGKYSLEVPHNDDNAYLYIDNKLIWSSGYSINLQHAWTGVLNENTSIEFVWINLALTSNASLLITPVVALPVQFVSLQAEKNNDQIEISWSSSHEKNVDYFIVEKSINPMSQNITEITKVEAKGNSTGLVQYTAKDENPTDGHSYYRIKSIDRDGSVQFSEFVMVTNEIKIALEMEVYPSPATSQNFNITLSHIPSDITINLIDAMGNLIYTQNSTKDFALNAPTITPGVYQVVAIVGNEKICKKIIIQ